MIKNTAQIYDSIDIESRVRSASPVELVIHVYDRIIDNLGEMAQDIRQGRNAKAASDRCFDLYTIGLVSALDFKKGGEVAENLLNIYRWSMNQISLAATQSDAEKLEHVVSVMQTLRGAWDEVKFQSPSGAFAEAELSR